MSLRSHDEVVEEEDDEETVSNFDLKVHEKTVLNEKEQAILTFFKPNQDYAIKETDYEMTVGDLLLKMIETQKTVMFAEGQVMVAKFEEAYERHKNELNGFL